MATYNPRLVFDVGMHKGEDTEFYLKMGFQVVAFEANPELVEECRSYFVDDIAAGRLQIIDGAIAGIEQGAAIKFFKNPVSVWGTIDHEWQTRNRNLGSEGSVVEVNRVDVLEQFERFGIPYYLKIDIEGADNIVIDSLRQLDRRPLYLSIESDKVDFSKIENEVQCLTELGYTRFKAVQQAGMGGRVVNVTDVNGNKISHVFRRHASGPFGEDVSKPWSSASEILEEYKRIFALYRLVGDNSQIRKKGEGKFIAELESLLGVYLPGWYDTHAALDRSLVRC